VNSHGSPGTRKKRKKSEEFLWISGTTSTGDLQNFKLHWKVTDLDKEDKWQSSS